MTYLFNLIAKYPDQATWLFGVLGTFILTAIYNGLQKLPHSQGVLGLIDQAIDLISVTTRKNAENTFKLPGKHSAEGSSSISPSVT